MSAESMLAIRSAVIISRSQDNCYLMCIMPIYFILLVKLTHSVHNI